MAENKITGRKLNEKWKVGALHSLYREDGKWYHHLKKFPGALFDKYGFIIFQNEIEYLSSENLQHGQDLHVPSGISSIPGYKKLLNHFEETLANEESNFPIDSLKSEISLETPLEELKRKALEDSWENSPLERLVSYHKRSEAIRLYAKKRANGICELCGNSGPFLDKNGQLFLEVHHLHKISDGGLDHPERVAGICPNCHRQVHYALDAEEHNNRLIDLIQAKEKI